MEDDGMEWRDKASLEDQGRRLDQVWAERLDSQSVSRAKIQEWIKSGLAEVDGTVCRKPGYKLAGGERLILRGEVVETRARAEAGEVRVVYRDERIVVLDKPAGLTVHPAPSCPEGTLVHRLLHHFPEISGLDAWRPGIVHRLDKDTSGLLVVALDEAARMELCEAFAGRRVGKTYLALVHGVPEREEGRVDLPMGRHPTLKTRMAVLAKGGREARTEYRVLWRDPSGRASLLEVRIHTGRTHQIRVHLAHSGHPIIGDRAYGAASQTRLEHESGLSAKLMARQMLHAARLSFSHPGTGQEMAFASSPPVDFRRLPLLLAERGSRPQRVAVVGPPGCGKSAALRLMERRGVPVFSADRAVAELYEPGRDGWVYLRGRYGERFVPNPDGPVDRPALLAAMLDSPGLRREVMDMVHPLIQYELVEFWQAHPAARIAAAEVPLFLEAGWHKLGLADVILGVDCPELRRGEFLAGRGWSGDLAATVDSWQWGWSDKRPLCDLIVENQGDLDDLDSRLGLALERLRTMRRDRVRRLREVLGGLFPH